MSCFTSTRQCRRPHKRSAVWGSAVWGSAVWGSAVWGSAPWGSAQRRSTPESSTPRGITLRGSALWSLVTILLLALAGCQEMPEYPMEPQISYQGLSYLINADSTLTGEVILSIGYTDGDGDLGLDDADTLYPFGPNDPHYYNLIIDYLKWDGTAFVETPLLSWNQQTQSYDTITFNARFKRLVFNDAVKPISGTIDYTMTAFNPLSPTDTVKFQVHLLDRALHESNTIETETISFH